jgi:dTDP-4-dehydrorhamnose reductase
LQDLATVYPDLDIVAAGRPDFDLTIRGSATRVIEGLKPDVVVNAAAYTAVDQAEAEPEQAFVINGVASGELAEATCELGARLIHLSTDYVYDGAADGEYTEMAPTNPLSVYGRSKLVGEELVREKNPQHVILRTAWVYSPYGRNFLKTIMRLAEEKDALRVVSDQFGCPTSAADLASGILQVISSWQQGGQKGLGEVYHLAGTGSTSWFELASFIMGECSRSGLAWATVEAIKTNDWPVAATRPKNTALDCTKFWRDFGYTMPRWEASVQTVIERL